MAYPFVASPSFPPSLPHARPPVRPSHTCVAPWSLCRALASDGMSAGCHSAMAGGAPRNPWCDEREEGTEGGREGGSMIRGEPDLERRHTLNRSWRTKLTGSYEYDTDICTRRHTRHDPNNFRRIIIATIIIISPPSSPYLEISPTLLMVLRIRHC